MAEVAAQLGFELMPWQRYVLDVALEVDPKTGRLVYRRVVLTVPRQSGKTTLLLALFAHRALGLGDPQVMTYAAQTGVDARKKFIDEHVPLLEKSLLGPLLKVRKTNGHEAVLWKNGSRHHISAGTEKSGHGSTLDLAVIDEAFAQPDGRLEQAFSPAMVTRPQPQLWFVSTAGKPSDWWFREKIEASRGLVEGSDGVAYFEWSAPEGADPEDRAVWRACMPALGHTITEEVIASELAAFKAEDKLPEFCRAYLNQWLVPDRSTALDEGRWLTLADPTAERGQPVFGLDVDQDRRAVIAVAWSRPDGRSQVMLSPDHLDLPAHEAAAACKALTDRWGGKVWLGGAAAGLIPDLERDHVPHEIVKAGQFPSACGFLVDALEARSVRHGNQPELNSSVTGAVWRARGTAGEREFDLTRSANVGPLAAATRALYGLITSSGSSVYEDRGFVTI